MSSSARIAIASFAPVLLAISAVAGPRVERVSQTWIATPSNNHVLVEANAWSGQPSVSKDGCQVVFTSAASNLVADDTNGVEDVFMYDCYYDTIQRISVGGVNVQANGPSRSATISNGGNYVVFVSQASNLAPGDSFPGSGIVVSDNNGLPDIFVRDVVAKRTYWVSHTWDRKISNYGCDNPTISGDGYRVAFECFSTNMVPGDTNGATDVFTNAASAGLLTRVSVREDGQEANNGSGRPSLSYDGSVIAYESLATNLVPGDSNGQSDVFIRHYGNMVTCVSCTGAQGVSNGASGRPAVSGIGDSIAYQTTASNLVDGDTNGAVDILLYSRISGKTRRVSVKPDGQQLPMNSENARISYLGHVVVFQAAAAIVPADENGSADIYRWHDGNLTLISVTQDSKAGNGESYEPGLASEPTMTDETKDIVFVSSATNLVIGDTNRRPDIFLRHFSQILLDFVAPTTVVSKGGTRVRVQGKGFLGSIAAPMAPARPEGVGSSPPTVLVGGVPASSVVVNSDTELEFVSPPLAPGSARDVVVVLDDGSDAVLPAGLSSLDIVMGSTADHDGDGMASWWETLLGLDPGKADADDDPDGDGLSNMEEYLSGSHPNAVQARYLAEGATGGMFETQIALANPTPLPAGASLRFLDGRGSVAAYVLEVPALTRVTLNASELDDIGTEFSTVVEADVSLLVDRTMWWLRDGTSTGYGSHTERAVAAPAPVWYLAEGATHSGFDLFYLVQNPNASDVTVEVRFLLPAPRAPIVKTYLVKAQSRFNVWVDAEGAALSNTDVSAVISSEAGLPIIVERAMYLTGQGRTFNAGHESAGVTEPSTEWFLAEGATGSLFDLFVLVANPNATDAQVEAKYLLGNGTVYTKTYTVGANSRFNIWVDLEEIPAGSGTFPLADVAVSTTVRSTNEVPVIVERAMWWPGDFSTWHEAHNSPGSTTTGTLWGTAAGEAGGPLGCDTFVLIANTSAFAGSALVTLLFEDGTTASNTYPLKANSRTNAWLNADFAQAAGRRFGVLVESLVAAGGTVPAQIVVERATYSDAGGVEWAAGSNALATKLR